MTPKSAVLAPTPSATVRIAASAKAGLRRRECTADRISLVYAVGGLAAGRESFRNRWRKWMCAVCVRNIFFRKFGKLPAKCATASLFMRLYCKGRRQENRGRGNGKRLDLLRGSACDPIKC
jgi:hypothetical protein